MSYIHRKRSLILQVEKLEQAIIGINPLSTKYLNTKMLIVDIKQFIIASEEAINDEKNNNSKLVWDNTNKYFKSIKS